MAQFLGEPKKYGATLSQSSGSGFVLSPKHVPGPLLYTSQGVGTPHEPNILAGQQGISGSDSS